jgi:hypothetical protein
LVTVQLQIHQTLGAIGLRYTPSRLFIHSQPADLQIRRASPQLRVNQTPGRLEIDQRQAFADEGRVPALELTHVAAEQAEAALAGRLAQRADLSRSLNHASNPRKLVADWLMQGAFPSRETALALVPQPFSVHVHYTPGRLSLELRNGDVHVDATLHRLQVSFTPGAVQAYLEQAASLEVSTPPVGELVDARA